MYIDVMVHKHDDITMNVYVYRNVIRRNLTDVLGRIPTSEEITQAMSENTDYQPKILCTLCNKIFDCDINK